MPQVKKNMKNMTLKERRVRFTILTANLIQRIATAEWPYGKVEVAMDEWTVHSPRLVKVGTERLLAEDRVHNPKGFHPFGLACDLLIYIDGAYITSGAHPIWNEINDMARTMDPAFGLGISFNDANHLSYGE